MAAGVALIQVLSGKAAKVIIVCFERAARVISRSQPPSIGSGTHVASTATVKKAGAGAAGLAAAREVVRPRIFRRIRRAALGTGAAAGVIGGGLYCVVIPWRDDVPVLEKPPQQVAQAPLPHIPPFGPILPMDFYLNPTVITARIPPPDRCEDKTKPLPEECSKTPPTPTAEPTPAPEPASIALLGVGLLGLFGMRHFRKEGPYLG